MGQYYPICGNVIIGTLPNLKIQHLKVGCSKGLDFLLKLP